MFTQLLKIFKKDSDCTDCSIEIRKAVEDNRAAAEAFRETLSHENILIKSLQKISKQVK